MACCNAAVEDIAIIVETTAIVIVVVVVVVVVRGGVATITALDYIHYAIISMTVEMLLMRVDVVMDATMNTSSVEMIIRQG